MSDDDEYSVGIGAQAQKADSKGSLRLAMDVVPLMEAGVRGLQRPQGLLSLCSAMFCQLLHSHILSTHAGPRRQLRSGSWPDWRSIV